MYVSKFLPQDGRSSSNPHPPLGALKSGALRIRKPSSSTKSTTSNKHALHDTLQQHVDDLKSDVAVAIRRV